MTDKRFYDAKGPVTLANLAEKCGVDFTGDGAYVVSDVAPLAQAGPIDVTFFDPKRTDQNISSLKAGVCIVSPDQAKQAPDSLNLLISDQTYRTFAAVGDYFYPFIDRDALDQTDAIHSSAQIGKDVTILPGAVIGADVVIGDGSYVGANATIGRGVTVGRNAVIQAGAAIAYSVFGDSVFISPGAAIGQAGFGFMMDKGEPVDLPHLGRVLIGDNVRIGANTTIDRGSLGDTLIGSGSRIDNLVQIAHGVEIGAGCIVVAQVGIAGSSRIGDFSAIGGQVGISDHITIGKGVRIVAQSGIIRDIEDGGTVGGSPALPIMEWRKQCVLLSQMVRSRNAKRKSGDSK